MIDPHNTPALDAVMEEVDRLRAGAVLLEELYTAMGPYFHFRGTDLSWGTPEEADSIWDKVRDHFGFDDSE